MGASESVKNLNIKRNGAELGAAVSNTALFQNLVPVLYDSELRNLYHCVTYDVQELQAYKSFSHK